MEEYTDPKTVYRKFKQIYKNTNIKPSTRKNKKYMVLDPNTNKWVHFGQLGYEDFTKHKDPIRRKKYHTRMGRFKEAYKYSPGYLSLVLLW